MGWGGRNLLANGRRNTHTFASTCRIHMYFLSLSFSVTHTHPGTHAQTHPALKSVKTGGILQNSSSILLLIYSPSSACKVQTGKNKRGEERLLHVSQRPKQSKDPETDTRCCCVMVAEALQEQTQLRTRTRSFGNASSARWYSIPLQRNAYFYL